MKACLEGKMDQNVTNVDIFTVTRIPVQRQIENVSIVDD